MGDWYIDRSRNIASVFSSAWYCPLVEYAKDDTKKDSFKGDSQGICSYLNLPTKNPYAILTYLRDLGIIDDENNATDFFKCALRANLQAEQLILLILLKRNDSKNNESTVKPFIVLSKAFSLMRKLGLPLKLNWNQCVTYLMSISSYDEITEGMIREMSADDAENPANGPDIWFNALLATGVFSGRNTEIILNPEYINFIEFFAQYGNELSPSANRAEYISQAKDPLYGIYTLFKNHPFEAIIAMGNINGILDYMREAIDYALIKQQETKTQEIITCLDVDEKNLSADALVKVLTEMYNSAPESKKSNAIRMFGFKYAESIVACGVSPQKLVDDSVINSSTYGGEITKAVNMYNSIKNNEYGISFVDLDDLCASAFDYASTVGCGINKIFYGVPGCGKSHHIQHNILNAGNYKAENVIRTTFYQDYSNTDFVGQILPKIVKGQNGEKDTVEYIFNPGPFTLALIQAISNPTDKVALVVEEINRGNAPAIFGDIFQLLDRDDDSISEYGIVNVGMLDYLNAYEFIVNQEKVHYHFTEIKIPGNMDIFATMNTSDQNVYTLDTAFTRRWTKECIPNAFNGHKVENMYVPGLSNYTWGEFVKATNKQIRDNLDSLQVNEDKQVGAFFVKEKDLLEKPEDSTEQKAKMFAYKVLEYLWADVSKLDHSIIFNPSYKTFEDIVKDFAKGVVVFNDKLGFKAVAPIVAEEE